MEEEDRQPTDEELNVLILVVNKMLSPERANKRQAPIATLPLGGNSNWAAASPAQFVLKAVTLSFQAVPPTEPPFSHLQVKSLMTYRALVAS